MSLAQRIARKVHPNYFPTDSMGRPVSIAEYHTWKVCVASIPQRQECPAHTYPIPIKQADRSDAGVEYADSLRPLKPLSIDPRAAEGL